MNCSVCRNCRELIYLPAWTSTVWHHTSHGDAACRRTMFAEPDEYTGPRCVSCWEPTAYPYKGLCTACNTRTPQPATERPTP